MFPTSVFPTQFFSHKTFSSLTPLPAEQKVHLNTARHDRTLHSQTSIKLSEVCVRMPHLAAQNLICLQG